MTPRKSDDEILREYLEEMREGETDTYAANPELAKTLLLPFVKKIRELEPRINSGWHLVCYCALRKEGDSMDSHYGPDFFEKNP